MPRETCNTCLRPPKVCYCSALVSLASTIRVVIIQHPQEKKHPFNTGRMTHLCLSNSELMVAETLSKYQLDTLLSDSSALLYPSLEWLPDSTELDENRHLREKSSNRQATIKQLIVIDATWKKSKRILHLNPLLQKLPRINLTGGLESNYKIRKTSIADGLSTIESIATAMQLLEQSDIYLRLLEPFEKMIALQQRSYTVEPA
ncbi:tRNA-uridine aminocarboxypropyltransferase [Microbulbifer sp. THAF38]|uniref:tRNA-uridine aminocarboxypropyltransferase n=1 Tax=Microbulbifer sp. THAF38 TaxID=2587856 RepID=UPI0012678CF7|nr:tRNA-uridine aminocarboxypropyltransferase [Microbulbifer sp. THAF38]QFT54101.1 DTW domain protein [Microbulbifer sp. THAF38]